MNFDSLLVEVVEKQLQSIEQGVDVETYLDQAERSSLFERLVELEEEGQKLFDQVSLKSLEQVFNHADDAHTQWAQDDHPAKTLFGDTEEWFRQSYRFLYNPITLLEMVRYFAAGRSSYEKEVLFRALVSKLVKTQETVRTITSNTDFLDHYLEKHTDFFGCYANHFAENRQLERPLSPKETVNLAMKSIINDISKMAVSLFEHVNIPLPENTQLALQQEKPYDALVLTMRQAPEDLFQDVSDDDYSTLVEQLMQIIEQSHLHSEIYFFQHIKREYLSHWLVHGLRDMDRKTTGEQFYQAGKARVYFNYEPLELPDSLVDILNNREQLDNEEAIAQELSGLQELSEYEFYELLLKMYMNYKDDPLFAGNAPVPPQTLASGGDTSLVQKQMVAQAKQKAEQELKRDPEKKKGGAFVTLFNAFKKTASAFTSVRKKEKEVEKQRRTVAKPAAEEESSAAPQEREIPPPLTIQHAEEALLVCFPVDSGQVTQSVPGQLQDICFNNSDSDPNVPEQYQEALVNLFNFEGTPNKPLNKGYQKFSSAASTILQSYCRSIKSIHKKYQAGGNVKSFHEDVLYLKVDDELILTLGTTKMQQSPNVGSVPEGKTCYVRLFVTGSLKDQLPASAAEHACYKEFSIDEESCLYQEVTLPKPLLEPEYEAMVVKALLKVVTSLPETEFEMLNDPNLIGFTTILQEKAKTLVAQGCSF